MATERPRRTFHISAAAQRSVRFAVATVLVVYEAVWHEGQPRWVLLAVYLTMMGLPIAERADELRRQALDTFGSPSLDQTDDERSSTT